MRTVDPQDPAVTYAAVLDALPIVAYMANPDGTISYVSRGLERFTGNSARVILEQGYHVVIHPDELADAGRNWDIARAAGAAYRDEFRLRFGDGTYRWVRSQADPMHGDSAEIVGWFGTVTDINDLRLAEQGLAEALHAAAGSARDADARAEFVERLLDASDDCVNVLDLEARLVSMSPNGQKALAINDFASVMGAQWLGFWSGADQIAAQTAVNAARGGGRGRFTGLLAVEGREKWWDVTVTPILGAHGRPERLLVVARDVTEMQLAYRALARSEERYRVLGEALPGVMWTASPDGLLDYVGGSSLPTSRLPDSPRLGKEWLDTVHPGDRARVAALWAASVASGDPYDAQFRARRGEGEYRWQLVRALPQHDECGAILRWVGVNVDIDDQRRADEAREQFVRLAEASDDFIGIGDDSGNATYVNEAGRRLLEIGSIDVVRTTRFLDYFAPEDRAFVETDILPTVAREGRWLGEYRFRNFTTGAAVPVWYNVFSLYDETGRTTGIATVSRDLRERRRVEAGMRALAEASAAMYHSLDFSGTVQNVAAAVARGFASFCTVEALDADGTIRSVAAAHPDPEAVALVERAAAARNRNADHPIARAIHRGESTLMVTLPDDWMETTGVKAAVGDDIDRLDVRSLIFVPIRSSQDGRVFGALTCALDGRDARGTYTTEDMRFAEEVAVRAGLAIDHARAYERERRIAVTLQEASLPRALPTVDRLYLSADYRPGNSEATIGGDWYDAFSLDDGRVAITVGDVLGKGLNAAVTMGRVRQAMRAVATVLPEQNAMLDVADRTVRAESADTYATAIAGIFDLAKHEYTFASAGHPGPAVRHPDGRIEEFTSPGMLLGLRERGRATTVTIAVPPGSTLIFFTDGLVEATRDIEEGHRRLHAAMADAGVAAAENPAHALVEHVLGGRAVTDDIAVLIAEVGPSVRFDTRLRTAAERA